MTPPAHDPRNPVPGDEPDEVMERALATVQRPAARAEFKQELGRKMLAAARGASTIPLVDVVDEPRSKPAGRRGSRLVWAGLAAAAAVVVLLVYLKPSDSRWKVLDGSTAGIVRVDGVAIRTEDRERLEQSLAEAHEIKSEGRLRLRYGDWYLLELAPNSTVALTPIEQRTRPEPLAFHVEAGTLRMCTGPSFHNAEMSVTTEELSLRVTGTIFAVDQFTKETCVCCLKGKLKARLPKSNATETVDEDRTFHVFLEGHPPISGTIVEAHASPLRELEALAKQLWP